MAEYEDDDQEDGEPGDDIEQDEQQEEEAGDYRPDVAEHVTSTAGSGYANSTSNDLPVGSGQRIHVVLCIATERNHKYRVYMKGDRLASVFSHVFSRLFSHVSSCV